MKTPLLPRFRVPALVQGTLTYFSSEAVSRRWSVVTFVRSFDPPVVALLSRQAWVLNEHADTARLLAVSSDEHALHRLGPNAPSTQGNLVFLADPLGRLHRAFESPNQREKNRCDTFVFDPDGRLQFHAVHGLLDLAQSAFGEILRTGRAQTVSAGLR